MVQSGRYASYRNTFLLLINSQAKFFQCKSVEGKIKIVFEKTKNVGPFETNALYCHELKSRQANKNVNEDSNAALELHWSWLETGSFSIINFILPSTPCMMGDLSLR